MPITKETRVALTAPNHDAVDMVTRVFKQLGYDKVTAFTNSRTCLDVALREQFQLFVTYQEMPEMTGLTMVQKMRATGNYGTEVHMFLVENMSDEIMNVFFEFNISIVLAKPFSSDRIVQKINLLCREEGNLSPFELRYRDTVAALSAGMVDMAKSFAMDLLKSNQASEKLFVLLGDIETQLNNPEEARKYYNVALRLNPNSAPAAHKLAKTYMMEKNFAKAAELMNACARLNPLNIELLTNAGLSNIEVGDMSAARQHLSGVLKLDKQDKTAGEGMAKVALTEGNVKEACQYLMASHNEKELIQYLNSAGIKLSQGNDVQGAIQMYLQCLEVIKNNEYIHAIYYNLGLGYAKLKDTANARKYLEMAISRKPDFEKAQQALHALPKSA